MLEDGLPAGGEHRAVILASGDGTRSGGQSLRIRALRAALSQHGTCAIEAIGCDRWGGCERVCRTSGRVTTGHRDVAECEGVVWYYDNASCADRAAELGGRLRRDGVSTVVCSGLETHRYVTELKRYGLRVVLDMHNVELPLHTAIHRGAPPGSIVSRQYTRDHLRLLEAAERTAIAQADEVWACSEADRALAMATYPEAGGKTIRVVPNVVDVAEVPGPVPTAERVAFVGRFDYYPNIEAATTLVYDVAPLLAAMGHELPVVLAGASLDGLFAGAPVGSNVELVSDPPTVAPIVAGSIVAVPLRIGGGSRYKILEAFALGAPVVSSPKGVEGLDVRPGVHYLEAVEPADFAAAIGALAGDPGLRASLAQAAWRLARDTYSVAALTRSLATTAPHA